MRKCSVVEPSFTVDETLAVADFILGHRRLLTMAEFAAGARDPEDICVRHDVDHDIAWARTFAEWEAGQGIRSTYFILPTAPYWPQAREHAIEISRLGHEVGIHNDALVAAEGDVDGAIALLREWADELRFWGIDVHGVCDHGGVPWSNPDIWREYGRDPTEASFAYEAYLMHREGAHYISDNRGMLRAPLADREGRQTHMLMHPCHWALP